LAGNKYKPKKALKAMMEHIDFQLNFLPIALDKVEHIIVTFYNNSEKRILLSIRARPSFQANFGL